MGNLAGGLHGWALKGKLDTHFFPLFFRFFPEEKDALKSHFLSLFGVLFKNPFCYIVVYRPAFVSIDSLFSKRLFPPPPSLFPSQPFTSLLSSLPFPLNPSLLSGLFTDPSNELPTDRPTRQAKKNPWHTVIRTANHPLLLLLL